MFSSREDVAKRLDSSLAGALERELCDTQESRLLQDTSPTDLATEVAMPALPEGVVGRLIESCHGSQEQ